MTILGGRWLLLYDSEARDSATKSWYAKGPIRSEPAADPAARDQAAPQAQIYSAPLRTFARSLTGSDPAAEPAANRHPTRASVANCVLACFLRSGESLA